MRHRVFSPFFCTKTSVVLCKKQIRACSNSQGCSISNALEVISQGTDIAQFWCEFCCGIYRAVWLLRASAITWWLYTQDWIFVLRGGILFLLFTHWGNLLWLYCERLWAHLLSTFRWENYQLIMPGSLLFHLSCAIFYGPAPNSFLRVVAWWVIPYALSAISRRSPFVCLRGLT